jgi:hypothetical protein
MSCSHAAASSRSASALRTGARLRARAATPWACAQRRGRGSWRRARASCCAHDASVFKRPRLDSRSGTFTDMACRLKTSGSPSGPVIRRCWPELGRNRSLPGGGRGAISITSEGSAQEGRSLEVVRMPFRTEIYLGSSGSYQRTTPEPRSTISRISGTSADARSALEGVSASRKRAKPRNSHTARCVVSAGSVANPRPPPGGSAISNPILLDPFERLPLPRQRRLDQICVFFR